MVTNCFQQYIKWGADILNIIEKFIPQSLTWPDFLGNQPAKLQHWSDKYIPGHPINYNFKKKNLTIIRIEILKEY